MADYSFVASGSPKTQLGPLNRLLLTDGMPEVLIIEDEPVSCRAMVQLLDLSGHRALGVGSAEEALRLVERYGMPRIALLDLNLPGMNGLDLLTRLLAINNSVQPILVTSEGGDSLLADLRLRNIPHLRKPVDIARLLDLVDERRQRAARN